MNAQTATTLELRADSQTGTLLGTCQVAATGGAWANQTCTLTPTTGVKTSMWCSAARSASTR